VQSQEDQALDGFPAAKPNRRNISQARVISEQTARTHVGCILIKLRLRDRAQAVVLAYESGLVKPGGDGAAGSGPGAGAGIPRPAGLRATLCPALRRIIWPAWRASR
jgi:hypothetical protein